MIYKIKQTKTNFSMQWIVTQGDNLICTVDAPYKGYYFDANITFSNNKQYRMYFNPHDTTYGKKLEDRLSFKIFDQNNNLIGNFVGRTKRTGKLFGGYLYYELNISDTQYIGYEVGRGAEGIALCLYRDDKLLSICDKNTKIINFKDEYSIYCENEEDIYISTLFTIYYDMARFANMQEIKLYSETDNYVVTFNKELKAKYDPEFIPRIKAIDGIVD